MRPVGAAEEWKSAPLPKVNTQLQVTWGTVNSERLMPAPAPASASAVSAKAPRLEQDLEDQLTTASRAAGRAADAATQCRDASGTVKRTATAAKERRREVDQAYNRLLHRSERLLQPAHHLQHLLWQMDPANGVLPPHHDDLRRAQLDHAAAQQARDAASTDHDHAKSELDQSIQTHRQACADHEASKQSAADCKEAARNACSSIGYQLWRQSKWSALQATELAMLCKWAADKPQGNRAACVELLNSHFAAAAAADAAQQMRPTA